jgi:hypothetical protein
MISAINPHRHEFKRTSRPLKPREFRAPRDPHGSLFANSACSEMLAAIPRATIAVVVARRCVPDSIRCVRRGRVSCVSWNIVAPHGMPAPKRVDVAEYKKGALSGRALQDDVGQIETA